MKKQILTLIIASLSFVGYAQVGVGTSNPTLTLEVVGTNDNGAVTGVDGVLVPRVNDADMSTATDGTVDGQMVYNTVAKKFYYWNGTAWTAVGGSANSTAFGVDYSNAYTGSANQTDYSAVTENAIYAVGAGPGSLTITLPDATLNINRLITVTASGKALLLTNADGSGINNTTTAMLISDGTIWRLIRGNGS
tara:strand:+ start:441 stop:1019 length:579 start_codon:yes stop_codon:yes gene_type:complete